VEHKNGEKTEGTKQQQTHEPENGLTDTKGKGTGRVGAKGGRRGIRGIRINIHDVGGVGTGRHGSIARREDK